MGGLEINFNWEGRFMANSIGGRGGGGENFFKWDRLTLLWHNRLLTSSVRPSKTCQLFTCFIDLPQHYLIPITCKYILASALCKNEAILTQILFSMLISWEQPCFLMAIKKLSIVSEMYSIKISLDKNQPQWVGGSWFMLWQDLPH